MVYIEGDPEGSRRIYLSGKHSDKYALVDEKWYEELSKYRWYLSTHGYAYRTPSIKIDKKRKKILLHRQLLGLEHGDKTSIDHINRIRLDNRICNLRKCTHEENCRNVSKHKGAKRILTSNFKGVSFSKPNSKWCVKIKGDGKIIYGGYFDDEILAAKRYDQLARKYYGEFANLNFPNDFNYSEVDRYLDSIDFLVKKSEYIGIVWIEKKKSWIAICQVKGKNIYLGSFKNPIDAAIKRDQYVIQNHLKRKLNFPITNTRSGI